MKLHVLLFSFVFSAHGQPSIFGKWTTVDDNTGEIKSIVEIIERDGEIYGRIVAILTESNPDVVCDQCAEDDERHNQRIMDMEIIQNLKKSGSEYGDGTILDREDGKVYRCKLWVEDGQLKVRGYWGPFYRTQTWRKST
jgi:uncharacterized protein (DUF2147 family)